MLQKYANLPTLVPPHPAHDTSLWGSQAKTAWEWGCDGRSETGAHYPIDKMFSEYISRGFRILKQQQTKTSRNDFAMFREKILNRTPFAIIRPADGEYHVLQNETLTNCDNWTFQSGGKLYSDLYKAIELAVRTCCYIGIPCECDNAQMAEWYYKTFHMHPLYTTFSNIFVNGNWKNYINMLEHDNISFTYIGPAYRESPFMIEQYVPIPELLVNDWNSCGEEYMTKIANLVSQSKNKIFLFSCGPISKILIAHAWATHPYNIYLDAGSSLDLFMKGSTNRCYTSGDQKDCQFSSSLISL
jgi:hypothetical protein